MQTQLGVRETYFHELFHSNDNDWSGKALRKDYDAILKKCPARRDQVPGAVRAERHDRRERARRHVLRVQKNNGDGVHEYAAELAVRYWEEHMEILAKGKLAKKPFKCGAPENGRSWKALIDQFFGGRDLTPRPANATRDRSRLQGRSPSQGRLTPDNSRQDSGGSRHLLDLVRPRGDPT